MQNQAHFMKKKKWFSAESKKWCMKVNLSRKIGQGLSDIWLKDSADLQT